MSASPRSIALLGLVFVFLHGCAGRSAPAPVVLLNSQVADGSEEFTQDTYKVQRGDTLFAVAWYTGNDYRDLAKYNDLSAPYVIHPGQTLRISPPPRIARTPVKPEIKTKQSTDPTSPPIDKSLVDRKKTQAYRESEKVVNPQNVTTVKKPTPSVKNKTPTSFPSKVNKWVWPAQGKLVETFSNAESGNKGIDIAGARGSNVVAAADGKVVYSGSALRGYGNLVIIKHTDTFLSAYAYNDTILVKERQWVSAGQTIATMGNSGTSSVKLHFEVRYRGKSLDPMKYLPPR
ncbi:peptidoglycan DD-metalloendopeptidase family protein [Alteromonas sp. McT4-15]|uniref:peptidoglycan DD-metalloendopeptidase family protein n=1 Tax=Alteromonas sp. McT4-15 TaxID=2881256 RepID=UPI001CF85CE6|nr:peptidoglycan DD-metalloendopeptidase family protein [Alteromonas sp. McT4-15]MCB4437956.1 peptidoglycan DD-metalloendopeptidase family protein [Alteromonas sp. McT4-15]